MPLAGFDEVLEFHERRLMPLPMVFGEINKEKSIEMLCGNGWFQGMSKGWRDELTASRIGLLSYREGLFEKKIWTVTASSRLS
jgi:hypothetical protein